MKGKGFPNEIPWKKTNVVSICSRDRKLLEEIRDLLKEVSRGIDYLCRGEE